MKHLRTEAKGTGICIGKAYVVGNQNVEATTVWSRCDFKTALKRTQTDLEALAADSDIFAAHYEMSQDELIVDTFNEIKDDFIDDETACRESMETICSMFESVDDEYLRARADDVRDVFGRILNYIEGKSRKNLFDGIPAGAVIVADNLTPSDTTLIDLDAIGGFVTEGGSSTSHVCIIASAHGKPAAVGVQACTTEIQTGDLLIVDAFEGLIFVNPEKEVIEDYTGKMEAFNHPSKQWNGEKLFAPDGRELHVYGNAGNPSDVERAIQSGADGIGLFRTEFLYMESKEDFPSEEVQFEAYKKAALICGDKLLTIRTLDIGGDKALSYWQGESEENPFLGKRAIRISLSMPEMFKTQLRAILRASAFGNIRVMFPMICLEAELDEALALLEECKKELDAEGTIYNKGIEAGIMIETPASVLIADELARKVSFFSLGTNDLTQYVMAADRGNASVARYYDPLSPAVQKAIRLTIEAAHRAGIECCMCGELAGNPRVAQTLISYGLDSFSVSAPAVTLIKSTL